MDYMYIFPMHVQISTRLMSSKQFNGRHSNYITIMSYNTLHPIVAHRKDIEITQLLTVSSFLHYTRGFDNKTHTIQDRPL